MTARGPGAPGVCAVGQSPNLMWSQPRHSSWLGELAVIIDGLHQQALIRNSPIRSGWECTYDLDLGGLVSVVDVIVHAGDGKGLGSVPIRVCEDQFERGHGNFTGVS